MLLTKKEWNSCRTDTWTFLLCHSWKAMDALGSLPGKINVPFQDYFSSWIFAFSDPRSGLVWDAPLRQHRWYWCVRDMEKKLSAASWGSDMALLLLCHLNLSPPSDLPWLQGGIPKQISHTITSTKRISVSVWNLSYIEIPSLKATEKGISCNYFPL